MAIAEQASVMPHEKPFTAMVMSIIAGSSTMAASIISMQNVDQAGTNMLLVHVDSIFVGLALLVSW